MTENEKRFSPNLKEAAADDIFYSLVMFPYPSGHGLHVGHASNYTINDVLVRYQRHQGNTVFNPIGFDSFGLPTENYAMKVGKPAYEVTEENIDYFLKQIKALDMSFDMERIVATSRPDYYKWTQWIFQQLYKAGLVYRDELWVNWCPDCQTVLANDQVVDGACERCKSEIIQKKMPQRFIKITDYADRLLEDLDKLDWPEETKIAQRNWIGRSEGAEIDFMTTEGDVKISVFTTRPDTLYGVTALVLAPENTRIDELMDDQSVKKVEEYRNKALAKTAVQRQQDTKEKTGVFSGVYAKHPLTKEHIPIRFADYVLPDYATGSVMMVPAHDERDFAFAKKFGIEVVEVISPLESETQDDEIYTGKGKLIHSGEFTGLSSEEAVEQISKKLEQQEVGRKQVTYKLRDWSVSRQRYWGSPIPVYYTYSENEEVPYFTYTEGDKKFQPGKPVVTRNVLQCIVKDKASDEYCFLKWSHDGDVTTFFGGIEEDEDITTAAKRELREEAGLTSVEVVKEVMHYHCKFYHPVKERNQYSLCTVLYVEADRTQQKEIAPEEAEKHQPVWMGASEFLKKTNNETSAHAFSVALGKEVTPRQKTERYNAYNPHPDVTTWEPHLIPEDELPVELPLDVENYKPKGKSPLADHPTFPVYTDNDGNEYRRECDTLDTFMCSSFYFLRYLDPENEDQLADPELLKKCLPVDFYTGGKEHTVGHLLYSRFVHKFLYDQGYVGSEEPFQKLVHQGMVQGSDGRKMSKRRGNVIDPINIVEEYGSDSLRTYLMFMGPVEAGKVRDDNSLKGVHKFLQRVEVMAGADYLTDANDETAKNESLLHQTIKGVTEDMEKMKYNTVVSKLMIFVNGVYEVGSISKDQLRTFAILLEPFAPQLAEKLWSEVLGATGDIAFTSWPERDEEEIVEDVITLPVQINGKVRANLEVEPGIDESTALDLAKADENVQKHLEGKEIKKVIFVQDRILNLVV